MHERLYKHNEIIWEVHSNVEHYYGSQVKHWYNMHYIFFHWIVVVCNMFVFWPEVIPPHTRFPLPYNIILCLCPSNCWKKCHWGQKVNEPYALRGLIIYVLLVFLLDGDNIFDITPELFKTLIIDVIQFPTRFQLMQLMMTNLKLNLP